MLQPPDDLYTKPEYALHLSIRENDVKKFESLLSAGQYDLDLRHYPYKSPLSCAITSDRIDFVRKLLAIGADPLMEEYTLDQTNNPMILATRLGRREIIKLFWNQDMPQHCRAEMGLSLLVVAATYGFKEQVREFLEWSNNWDDIPTALKYASHRWNADVLDVLLNCGHPFDQTVLNEALWKASGLKFMMIEEDSTGVIYTNQDFQDSRKTINILLDAGADVNSTDPKAGLAAMHIAARHPETNDALATLLLRGADANQKSIWGQTALYFAVLRSISTSRTRGLNVIAVKLLVDAGSDLAIQDDYGQTPLHTIARDGNASTFYFCMEKYGAREWPIDGRGETLLHAASTGNQVEILDWLLANGAKVNELSSLGRTPLLLASVYQGTTQGFIETCKFLISHGANATLSSGMGWTVLHRAVLLPYCIEASNLEEMLLSLGADIEAGAVSAKQKRSAYPNSFDLMHGRAICYDIPVDIVRNQTPLHFAAQIGSVDWVNLLLKYKAKPSAKDSTRATPAICACYVPEIHGYPFGMKLEIVKILLGQGVSFEETDEYSRSVAAWGEFHRLPFDWRLW